MHPILADVQGDWLTAAGLLLGGICTSLLALGAVIPAWRGKRPLTFVLAAPAFLLGVAATFWLGSGNRMGRSDTVEQTGGDAVAVWMLMAGAPLFTSLLVVSVLFLRRRYA
jgi:hypothetical protein